MSVTPEQLKVLMTDLNPNRVKSRSQSGRSFSYLEGFDVKATLIRVFGFGGFSAEVIANEVVDKSEVKIGKDQKDGWRVSIMSTVRLTIHGQPKDNHGVVVERRDSVYTESAIATSSQPSLGDAMDMAIKSAATDALKRAATYLGTQFGLSLYADGSTREVVKVIVAPDQKWPTEDAKKMNAAKTTEEAKKALEESLGAKEVRPTEEDVALAGQDEPAERELSAKEEWAAGEMAMQVDQ